MWYTPQVLLRVRWRKRRDLDLCRYGGDVDGQSHRRSCAAEEGARDRESVTYAL